MESTPYLATKLHMPPIRPNHVPRPRLVERLNTGLRSGHQLTLISAPAGFGKTTLVTEWLQQVDRPVIWISLDEDDNDPIRFLNYLGAAFHHISPELVQLIQSMLTGSQPVVVTPFITALINDIARNNDRSFFLILDDYHLIDSPEIHEGIAFLIDHQPTQIHLVLTCRADPPFQLSRMRARDLATEFRARDLRFTDQEVTIFLNEKIGLNLTPEMITTLEQRTEGWIAGLQLAAVSLHQQDDPARFITAFAGDDRYIADFLAEEVLQGQQDEIQKFLLSTAILKRFCAPLCDAILGSNNSREILTQLDNSNLFIVPLDNKRHWYRYYHLFADLLCHRLEETFTTAEIIQLHQKASLWLEENQLHIESVEHALAAGDYENVIRLIEKYAGLMLERSEINILTKWWLQIPQQVIIANPRLCIMYSWAWVATGHPEKAELCVQAVEEILGATVADLFAESGTADRLDPQIRGPLVEVAVVKAQLAVGHLDVAEALKLCNLVLANLETDKDQPHLFNIAEDSLTVVYFIMGVAHKFMGDLSAAEQEFSEAANLGSKLGNMHIVAVSFGHLANVQTIQGRLEQAVQTCEQGLQVIREMGGRLTPMSGLIQVELGNLKYERNETKAALHDLEDGIAAAKPWGHWETFLPGYVGLVRLKAGLRDWTGAFATLEELEDLAQNTTQPIMLYVQALRARLWVSLNEVDQASRWVRTSGLTVDDQINVMQAGLYFILSRVLILQGKYDQAAGLIARLLEVAETGGRWGELIELLVMQTMLLEAQGQQEEALQALSQALTLAKPGGYIRVFIDEGEPMARLLYRAAEKGITPAYTGMLLAAFEQTTQGRVPASMQVAPASAGIEPSFTIVEPLSERETEVLTCIADGLSNHEIALRLIISLTTVKTHTRNIYRKLDVNSRTQAVATGKSLGILP